MDSLYEKRGGMPELDSSCDHGIWEQIISNRRAASDE